MTNEEKAKEIGKQWYFDTMNPNEAAYRASIQMAKWKDQQFEEEKKELRGLVKMLPVNETNQTIIDDLSALLG